jgi:hypothetical protein
MVETGDLALVLVTHQRRKAMGRGLLSGDPSPILVDHCRRQAMGRGPLLRMEALNQ